jgi:hypothetical protein
VSAKAPPVLTVRDVGLDALCTLLEPRGMVLRLVDPDQPIPGSYWGAPEAGLTRNELHLRQDTPVHSALHEAAHFLCMTPERQRALERDAGGDYDEENAVCFLQIVLAGQLAGAGSARIMADMDAWGYTFRLGSTRRWFEEDADDARAWLVGHHLLDANGALP